MPDDNKPDKTTATDPLKALPEDLGLGDEIRRISRKVNRIMKRVESANAAVRAIISPETEGNATEEGTASASAKNAEKPPESA